MRVALDTTSFRNAMGQLASGLAKARAKPRRGVVRDGVIQPFEHACSSPPAA